MRFNEKIVSPNGVFEYQSLSRFRQVRKVLSFMLNRLNVLISILLNDSQIVSANDVLAVIQQLPQIVLSPWSLARPDLR